MGRYDFVYVHTDIPEGMTIRGWREQRAAEQIAMRVAAREARHCRRARDMRRWLEGLPAPARRVRVRHRSARA